MRANGPALAASVLLAAGVKIAYSHAGPDDLRWMTAPMQALVGLASGIEFSYEAGYGYVNLAHHLVIATSCTGVNYLIAVFGLLTFTLVPAVPGPWRKLLVVGPLAVGAYGVTVVVNAIRIALGVALHEGGFAWPSLSAERVHRLAGIVVYFVALVAVRAATRAALRRAHLGTRSSPLLPAPLAAYGLVALALPLANGAFAARPLAFAEHSAWVVGVTLLLSAMFTYGVRRPKGLPGPLRSERY